MIRMDAKGTIKSSQLRDQFSDMTRTVRRNMLIAASIAVLLSLPGFEVENFLGIHVAREAPQLAIGAVALIATYEYISFVIYGLIDHRRWRVEPSSILLNAEWNALETMQINRSAVTHEVAAIKRDVERVLKLSLGNAEMVLRELVDRFEAMVSVQGEELEAYQLGLKEHEVQLRHHDRLQLFRIYAVDWAMPLIVGGYCIAVTWRQMLALLSAVIQL
jgi:hypothetical protein